MKRPVKLDLKMARYLMLQKATGRTHFPFVTMLEPLEACNLMCIGCGRVIEYENAMDRRLSVEESLSAVHASGAPIVSISGGEPLLHPQIEEIVRAILAEKRFIYLCTNGLLLQERLDRFPLSPYLSFVVHLDGTKTVHDHVTRREGTYDAALAAIQDALRRGFRVNTNTTLFHGSDVEDLHKLFAQLTQMGVEGLMVSPGYAYEDVSDQDLFLQREETLRSGERSTLHKLHDALLVRGRKHPEGTLSPTRLVHTGTRGTRTVIVVSACFRTETAWIPKLPDVHMIHTPMGETAAGALERLLPEAPSMIVSTGFCGGLVPTLRSGKLVLAEAIHHSGETITVEPALFTQAKEALRAARLDFICGPIRSSDRVVQTKEEKHRLQTKGAIAVDMESGRTGKADPFSLPPGCP